MHSFAHNSGQFVVSLVFCFGREPFAETFNTLVYQHAFAGNNLATLGFCHLEKLCHAGRVYDVAYGLARGQVGLGQRRLVYIGGHAYGGGVDNQFDACRNLCEFCEGHYLNGGCLACEKLVQPIGQCLSFFLGAAHNGELVALFHQCVGDGLGSSAVTQQCHGSVFGLDSELLQVADTTVGVGGGATKGSSDNSIFPVQGVHAVGELGNVRKFVDQFHDRSLVGNGDVGSAVLENPKTPDGVSQVFGLRSVWVIYCIYAQCLEKGVVHQRRFTMSNRITENTERFGFSINI